MTNLELNEELLKNAWNWTSFDPEKRAEVFKKEYQQAIEGLRANVDGADISESQKAECFEYWASRIKRAAEEYLSKHSRCLSSFITGPARFPVKKAEKANESADKALNNYMYAVNKSQSKEIFERYLTTEQKQNRIDAQKWRELHNTICDLIWYKTITPEDVKQGKWAYNAFPHLKGQFTTQAKNGNFAICEKVLATLSEQAQKGIKLKQNISILTKILDDYKAKFSQAELNKQESKTSNSKIEGVQVVENAEENRLQILFSEKPSAETISLLKKAAFRWSPKNKAWQRYLTPSSKIAWAEVERSLAEGK